MNPIILPVALASALLCGSSSALEPISITKDGKGFEFAESRQAFTPRGFNYDHDEKGRLIEDYWEAEWPKVGEDFREMKALGANVVRIHLQVGRFLVDTNRANEAALAKLSNLLRLADKTGLYLDLTGLGCYHKADVPAWYDALDETGRWAAQAEFWSAIARTCKGHPAVFCYDLMNEPVSPSGPGKPGQWLGPAFAGKHFVQWISLEPKGRKAPDIAVAWIRHLREAIRRHDTRTPVTVGLVDWSLDRPNRLRSGFIPERMEPVLDFLCVHLYPEQGKVAEALETLAAFQVGKPLVIEETFPLKASMEDFDAFMQGSKKHACGYIGFYWGAGIEELRRAGGIGEAMTANWLEWFRAQP